MHPVEDIRRSGATLTVEGLNWVRNCDACRKLVDVKLLYNPSDRKFRSVGEKMLEWEPCPNRGWAPRPRFSSPGERERNAVIAIRVGVNMLQFCSVSNSLSHTTLSIRWGVYFSTALCPLVFIVSSLWFCMHMSMQQKLYLCFLSPFFSAV